MELIWRRVLSVSAFKLQLQERPSSPSGHGSMATAHGQFSRVADPAMVFAGAGEPDLASWALVYSNSALVPALGTQRSPEELKATSPGDDKPSVEMVTRAVGEPDLASCALVNSTASSP